MGASLPPKEANLFKLIVKSYETKQYKKGLKAADQILKKFPDHGETLSMKGLTLNCMDRKSEAYELVRLGLKNDLKSHVCWHVYGLLYRSDREYREAIKCYRNALRIDPDNIEILRDLSLLQAQMRDLSGFVETRQQLLTLKPNHRMNWIGFAVAHHLNSNGAKAVEILEAYEGTLEDDYPPDNERCEHSEMLLYKISLLEEYGFIERALEELHKKEPKIVDKLTYKEQEVSLLVKLGRLEEGANLYKALLIMNPDNYSRRVSRRALREMFLVHGPVQRVYIPKVTRNPKYRFSTFAFMQFGNENGLRRAVENLNGAVIDGRRITVGVARYKESRAWRSRSVLEIKDTVADAQNKEKVRKNIMEMHISSESSSWVKRSLTGIIKHSFKLEFVHNALVNEGYDVQIVRWGYVWNSCVIVFNSAEEISDAWMKKKEDLQFWFDRLGPLLNDEGVPLAFCLVELFGLPLLCWNESFLESLAGRWGRVVDILDDTKQREVLTKARLLIRVASPFDVPDQITIGSYGRSFKVTMKIGSTNDDTMFFSTNPPVASSDEGQFGAFTTEKEEDRVGSESEEGFARSVEENRQRVDSWMEQGASIGFGGVGGNRRFPRISKIGSDINGKSDVQMGRLSKWPEKENALIVRDWKNMNSRGIQLDSLSVDVEFQGCEDDNDVLSLGDKSVDRVVEGLQSMGDNHCFESGVFIRRARRHLLREALERVSISTASSSGFSDLLEEALATWEETKLEKIQRSFMRRNGLNYLQGVIESPSVGSSGGLLFCWDDNVFELQNQCTTRRFIAISGRFRANNFRCRFINVYEPSVEEEKESFFEELSTLIGRHSEPICVGGDLNVYLHEDEKIGRAQNRNSIEIFSRFLLNTGLIDLPLSGGEKPFKLFNYLMDEAGFEDLVSSSIQEWKRDKFPGALISELELKIQKLEVEVQQQQDGTHDEKATELKDLRSELWKLHKIKEKIWFQNFRSKWVEDGDRNTRFFHTCASVRRKQNALNAISSRGKVIQDPNVIKATVKEHFFKAFNDKSTLEVKDFGLDFSSISSQQRPISLVGGLYKILSKCPSRRLRSYFKKAYDSVDWDILFLVMEKMGFGSRWIGWIRKCVTTASVSVLVNGVPIEEFPMAKGLRQGCSLSPLLFNFIGELLNLLILKAVAHGLFSGLVIGSDSGAFKLSHLQFADDLIIFCGASKMQILNVKRVLRVFQVVFGLQLNLKKSKPFGVNLNEEDVQQWANSIGCSVGCFPSEYLALPLGASRNSKALWSPVVNNFSNKLAGWKASSLSLAGSKVPQRVSWIWRSVVKNHFKEDILALSLEVCLLFELEMASSSGWSWDVQFRRNLNDWEVEQWVNLMNAISYVSLSMEFVDGVIWKGSGDEVYTVKSDTKICSPINLDLEEVYFWKKIIWRGQFPPRVESFMWQVVLGKLAVRTELVKRGIQGIVDIMCPLCKREEESPSHLFFTCSVVWSIWNKFLNFWKIKNHIVFEGGKLDLAEYFFLARFRLASWFLAKYKEVSIPKGFVKLNVDAATTRDWKNSGIGGVLKDSSGLTVSSFKESAGPGPPTYMELKAIQKGLMFYANLRERKGRFIIESDSKVAVDWIKEVDLVPDVYAFLIRDIVHRLNFLEGVVRWVNRTANLEADALSKAGIG
ncbi:hypothetical protein F3Y22_tig00111366pilonHSYRG00093 [Hibiscus syriacus]|uniref:Uncharacterized protein n=2 Tax=Magnoliopsida TaxID=3398 RepID=A0A6A2YN71_HIBSY|nr:hypothetical protein F3Y22_tig00111366pilonHSYRG00093 [Hibiscus syriacus]